ncbi:MAG TPA: hypothetical protein VHD33_00520, partial [Legionellaceae bacterium]|nr:hypothetical protein [Legionellaceae bacterium]
MQEPQERLSVTQGPFASLRSSGEMEWIQLVIDKSGKVEQFKTAAPEQFVKNEWQTDKPIPEKLSVYAPGVEKPEICFVFIPQVIRFYFRPNGQPWPGEPFSGGLFRNASVMPKTKNVVSNDHWCPDDNLLTQINEQYRQWQTLTSATATSSQIWHAGQTKKPFNFMRDDQGHKKPIDQGLLSDDQVSEIQLLILDDWIQMKEVSSNATEYCQVLRLLLAPSLSNDDLIGLPSEVTDKLVKLQKWFLPITINQFPAKRFYRMGQPEISINDVQAYLHQVVVAEIKQYFPKQGLPPFIPDQKLIITRIGSMRDEMGKLLFQLTEAMSAESQEQVMQLRQLMSGNADNLNLTEAENLLRVVSDIGHRQTNAQTQAIESDLVAIQQATSEVVHFDETLNRLKFKLKARIRMLYEPQDRAWLISYAQEHCSDLNLSNYESNIHLLTAIVEKVTENKPRSEQNEILIS